jgi:S-adenosylmethionine hydrolase
VGDERNPNLGGCGYHPRMAPVRPVVSLLTDFGLRDPSAAICKGVILGICPDAQLIDISHEVAKFAVREAAFLLWSALPYLPVAIHVAVVDPGVGTDRRPIAIRSALGDVLIGPDNGVLSLAAQRAGGLLEARELTNPEYRLTPTSASFHGRDIFAPAAGHLAAGADFASLGPSIDPAGLVPLSLPTPTAGPGWLSTSVIYIDSFGNAKLSAMASDLRAALGALEPGTRLGIQVERPARAGGRYLPHPVRHRNRPRFDTLDVEWTLTFGSAAVGEPILYEDAYGRLCLAVNQGSAADRLRLQADAELMIHR